MWIYSKNAEPGSGSAGFSVFDPPVSRTVRSRCLLCRHLIHSLLQQCRRRHQLTKSFLPFPLHSSVPCLRPPLYQSVGHPMIFVLPAFHNPYRNYLLTYFMNETSILLSLNLSSLLPYMSLHHSSYTFFPFFFWTCPGSLFFLLAQWKQFLSFVNHLLFFAPWAPPLFSHLTPILLYSEFQILYLK